MELSNEQEYFVNEALDGKNILVDACIGSGKTTSIQELCNRFSQERKILYLTYNKLLKVDAINKIKNKNVKVQNYHGFAYWLLSSNKIKAGVSELIKEVNKRKIEIPSYDTLIIDEYQDIDSEIAEFLEKIKASNPKMQIIAVGDMKQKIYDFTSLDVKKFIEKFLGSYTHITFTYCFRLGTNYASKLGISWHKEINGVNKKMKVNNLYTMEEVVDEISRHKPEEILCLGTRTGQMSDVLNELELKYPHKFNKNTVFASIRDKDGGVTPTDKCAIFTTYDGSKGLERPYCYLFDFTEANWALRMLKPNTKVNILKNIFLVAASRGKEEINFVKIDKKTTSSNFLSFSYLESIKDNNNFMSVNFEKPFDISDMFDFKYKEDVDACFDLLNIREILMPDDSLMKFKIQDGMIDLSPVVGIWQQAIFFKNYNVWDVIETQRYHNKIIAARYDDPVEKQVLALVASITNQNRYITQVKTPFISKEEEQMLKNRLSLYFKGNEVVEQEVYMSLLTNKGNIEINGRVDAIDSYGNIVELKHTSELSHEHFLQIASYVVATQSQRGLIWNTKTNKMYEVSVKDNDKFVRLMTVAITKGVANQVLEVQYTKDLADLEASKRKKYNKELIEKRMERKLERQKKEEKENSLKEFKKNSLEELNLISS